MLIAERRAKDSDIMPKRTLDFSTIWLAKIQAAERFYKTWEDKFSVKALELFYDGFQDENQEWGDDPYTLNLFFSTIETKLPSYLFRNPVFHARPKPRELAIDPEQAFTYASNLEDALGDWVQNPDTRFSEEVEQVVIDSFFRFGILEVGYSANWITNPKAGKPMLRRHYDEEAEEGVKVREPEQLPIEEQLYVKHIPACDFRVSSINNKYLEQCDWCGYRELVATADLIANPEINLSKDDIGNISINDASLAEISEVYGMNEADKNLIRSGSFTVLWKIWDNRAKRHYLFSESHGKTLLNKPFDIFPFEDLRYRRPLKGFYPVPYTFNWKSPQIEINDVRNANRAHRRKMKRVYEVKVGTFTSPEEQAKFNLGEDGTQVEVNQTGQILPIPTADLGASSNIALTVSQSDFNIISGTTAEQRNQVVGDVTATQASISNDRAVVRESFERNTVANFCCRVAKKVLKLMKARFVNPMILPIPNTRIENENLFGDMELGSQVREVDPLVDFGPDDFDFDVNIEIESTSPVANEAELNRFLSFLSLLSQFPQFAMSPMIIREMAFRTGYKNEKVIKEFQMFAQLQMVGQIEEGTQALGGQTGGLAQQQVESQTPPNNEQVREQLRGQGVPVDNIQ